MTAFRLYALTLFFFAVAAVFTDPVQGQEKKPPYWASLSKDEARMRAGPSMDYPANWIYRRRDLPVKVVAVYSHWRKIEDPDGTQGWMHVRLLSDQPTAIITRSEEHTSELQSLMRISYAVFCLKKTKTIQYKQNIY